MKSAKSDKPAKTERLTVTLGNDQRRQIAAIARRRRTSAATVIRWALDEYIAENAEKHRPDPGSRASRSKSR